MLLLPTWSIVHSRVWKLQIPYLARHCRVVTFDGRGNGLSDRPEEPAAYAEEEFAADALAVLDATGTDARLPRRRTRWARSARCSSRPSSRSASRASSSSAPPCRSRARRRGRGRRSRSTSELDAYEGWAEVQPPLLARATTATSSSSSSRRSSASRTRRSRSRTASAGACETTPETLIATAVAPRLDEAAMRELAGACRLPGARDPRAPRTRSARTTSGAALAELTGGRARHARGLGSRAARARPGQGQPAAARVRRARRRRRGAGARGRSRRKRALYVSSPIGLGHARRDVAIADELRTLHPDLEIDWLAQHPVTAVLEARGERIHPASAQLANESRHIESRVGRARPALLPGVAADGRDPARELHGLPRPRARRALRPLDRRRGVGARLLPAREPGAEARRLRLADRLRRLAADARRRRARGVPDRRLQRRDDRAHRALSARLRDRAIFVGEPDDVVPASFGAGPAGDPRLDASSTSTSPAT